MKYKFFVYVFVILTVTSCITDVDYNYDATGTLPSIINNNNWKIVFEDNFNTLDTINNWKFIPKGTDAWDKFMSRDSNCYEINNGELKLKGILNKDTTMDSEFMTGGIWSSGKKTITYGKVEIRAKFNKVEGAWPAIWMISDEKPWPYGGEIDILETINKDNSVLHTVHTPYTLYTSSHKLLNYIEVPIKDKTQYNTYIVIINKDEVIFAINGKKTFVYKNLEPEFDQQFPFDNKKFLILSMQLNNAIMTGKVNTAQLPAEMTIDWVRFYEKIDENLPDYDK